MGSTIKDIATRLKISTSTVSYALNGGPRHVPESVRLEVLRVAKELNYRPNRLAKSLVTGRSNTIGVLPTEATQNLAVIPYFQACFNGILNEAEIVKNDVLIYSSFAPNEGSVDELILNVSDGRADGIILIAPFLDSPVVAALQERGIPHTIINAAVEGSACLACDNRLGVGQAVRHLHELGHTKIAHLAGLSTMQDGRERRDAFCTVMSELGLPIRSDWIIETDFSPHMGQFAANQLLADKSDRPTAVFCANDEIAIGAYHAAWERQISIPEELSIVGFDNQGSGTIMLPGLTTIQQPLETMGRDAVSKLVALIDGKCAESEQYQTELIIRGSTTKT